MKSQRSAYGEAVLAAACYGISAPAAKLLLDGIPPMIMAALLYLGAGLGMGAMRLLRQKGGHEEAKLSRRDLPYTVAMVALDVAAPILLMLGLGMTTSGTAALLGNFEIVATTIIALVVFREAVGRRMWAAVVLITLASAILSVDDFSSLTFSPGSVLVLAACVCWGVENNCTSKLSLKDPLEIVIIKGFGSGLTALVIALVSGERIARAELIAPALLLGFVAYGLSIYFYIRAQRNLGAARTSAAYAIAPFIGVGLSFVVLRELPTVSFVAALVVMTAGAYLAVAEKHTHRHTHVSAAHEHRHSHDDHHHTHTHIPPVSGEHSHAHIHEVLTHEHTHTPDVHHEHTH